MDAHKAEFAAEGEEPPALERIRPQVTAAVRMEKSQEAINQMIQRGLEASDVRIHAERIR